MTTIKIFPLDAELARRLAERRGLSVPALFSNLLREDAALTILGLRNGVHGTDGNREGDDEHRIEG
jgi:hypothetical protein